MGKGGNRIIKRRRIREKKERRWMGKGIDIILKKDKEKGKE